MKGVIYARVSTEDQDPGNQVRDLEAWAARRECHILEIYQEAESAWRQGHQHELSRLLTDAERGRFDVVLVWALDRMSREGPLAVLQLVDRLKRSGVRLLSYQEPWTEAPGELGDLLYAVVAWVARWESERRSERTKAGQARAKAQGKHLGRPVGSKDSKKRRRRTRREIRIERG